MEAKLLDGKLVAQTIRESLKEKVRQMVAAGKRPPHLAAVLVGANPASETYVSNKMKACEDVGFRSTLLKLGSDVTQQQLLDEIEKLNEDAGLDGFIVQLPLPGHIDNNAVIAAIDPGKDADGFHPENYGKMAKGLEAFIPATPYGILKLIEHYRIPTEGKHVVVIGRSGIVGSPISILLARTGYPGNATVTLCHSKTKNLEEHTRQADIIVAAVGRPGMLTADMVKEGAVVIDVGINRLEDTGRKSGFRLAGDADFEGLRHKCSYITPVPGGVGPMTIACLLLNTMHAAQKHQP